MVIGSESRELVLDVLDEVDDVDVVADATCAVDVPSAGSCPVAICT